LQVAYGALQAVGNAGASLVGGALLASLGSGQTAYLWVFLVSAVARLLAALLIVKKLPRLIVRLPATIIVGAWTLAIRPWGGTIVRPFIEGIGRWRK
jgi:hypothetical protein